MEQWLSCGQFKCCVAGDRDLIRCIDPSWVREVQNSVPSSGTITIHLAIEKAKQKRELPDGWTVLEDHGFSEAAYVHNGKTIFSLAPENEKELTVRIRKALNSHVRIGLHYGLMLSLYRQCVGLHGVTLACGGEIIILSAPSGTGKTTLSKLLEKHCDAVVINGDFALLSLTDDGVIYEPTPFCGTSGRSLNHRFRVNRVVFLGQAKKNMWRDLDGREAMMRFMSNAFVPDWDSSIQQAVNENVMKCISSLRVNAYDFAPVQEAAEEFLKRVEADSMLRSE